MAPLPTAPSGPTARVWSSARPSVTSRSSAATALTNCSEYHATAAPVLLAGGFAQRFVDAVLPARPALLEIVQHLPIEAQRHLFLGAGYRGLLQNGQRRRRRLRGRLEHRFGGIP